MAFYLVHSREILGNEAQGRKALMVAAACEEHKASAGGIPENQPQQLADR